MSNRFQKFIFCMLIALPGPLVHSAQREGVTLVQDTDFVEGFGAAFIYGK